MKKTLLIILGVLAILIIAGGVWYYLDNKNKAENRVCTMEAKLCPDGSYVGRVAPNCEFAECPTKKSFENAINNQDYKLAKSLISSTVNFIIEATECCGDILAEEVNFDYIKNAGSFNFAENQDIVEKIKDNYPKFKDSVIGIADNKQTLIFHINSESWIDSIYFSATYELFGI